MEENRKILKTSGFVSRAEPSAQRRPSALRSAESGNGRERSGAGYLIARLGICALLLCGVIAVKLAGDDETLAVIGSYTSVYDEEKEEERLGRLKFVDLPSVIDVFAPQKAAVLPAVSAGFELVNDGFDLILAVNSGAEVVSPVQGRVFDSGVDPELGGYVSVHADDDCIFTVYGVENVSVERDQPVRRLAKLGEVSLSRLTVRITKAGRPVSPAEVFSLGRSG